MPRLLCLSLGLLLCSALCSAGEPKVVEKPAEPPAELKATMAALAKALAAKNYAEALTYGALPAKIEALKKNDADYQDALQKIEAMAPSLLEALKAIQGKQGLMPPDGKSINFDLKEAKLQVDGNPKLALLFYLVDGKWYFH